MTDIVERLSENSKRAESPIDALAMSDAAAEIARLRTKVAKADALAEALYFYARATVEYPSGNVTFQPGDDNGQRAEVALAAYREGSDT